MNAQVLGLRMTRSATSNARLEKELLAIIAEWRQQHTRLVGAAKSDKLSSSIVAHLQGQAFTLKHCADELEKLETALTRRNPPRE